MIRWPLIAGLLFCLLFCLHADVIHLITGGRVEGEVIEENDDYVVVRTYGGIITSIEVERVEEIERKPTRWQVYTEKSKEIDPYDADAHWKLAKWCDSQGLYREYKVEIELTLSLKPDHKEALAAYEKLRRRAEERAKKVKRVVRRPSRRTPVRPGEKPVAREETPPSPNKKAKIGELIDKFFSIPAENHKDRQAVIDELSGLEPLNKSDVMSFKRRIFKQARKGPKANYKGGTGKLNSSLYPGTYHISVPRGRKGTRYPLVIGLHGGGQGVGDGRTAAQKWSFAARYGAICVFPTVIRKEATAWNKEREEKYVMALIEEMKRTFPIDTNRIYLVGHSMGGYGTWSIGTHYADVFAGLAPCAGGIFVMRGGGGGIGLARGTVVNLKATPIYFYHGADDNRVPPASDRKAAEVLKELKAKYGPYEYVYKEYNGIGHGLPPGGMGPIIKWLFKHKRDPYPKMIVWEPSRDYKSLFWWIKNRGGISQIVAKYDKSKNEITIDGPSSGFSIYLNDKMMDLNKPIRVLINGKEAYNDYANFSAAAMLDSIADKRDPEQYFYAKIDF